MKTTRKENAQTALIGAFMRGKLKHLDCCECAVAVIARTDKKDLSIAKYSGAAGYNFAHINSIESSFEFHNSMNIKIFLKNIYADRDGFLGLTAVFETLDKIDQEVCEETVNLLEMI